MPWIPLIIAAGTAVMSAQQKAEQEDKDRRERAATTLYSPWTYMSMAAPEHADTWGTIGGGLTAGLQGMQNMQAAQDQHNWMEKGYSPYTGFGPGASGVSGSSLANSRLPTYGAGLTPDQAVQGYGAPGTYWNQNPYSSSSPYASTYPKGYFGFMGNGPYKG